LRSIDLVAQPDSGWLELAGSGVLFDHRSVDSRSCVVAGFRFYAVWLRLLAALRFVRAQARFGQESGLVHRGLDH